MGDAILVTGGTGFIGRHLAAAVASAGHSVEIHSSAESDIGLEFSPNANVRHVFHLAGRTFVPDSWRQTAAFYSTNVQGTVNVMEFCRNQNVSVTLLSSYVYGVPTRLPIAEDHPVAAVNPYAHTKILAEEIARFYAHQFGLGVSIVRPFNIYGPGQDRRFLIAQLVHASLDQDTPEIEVSDLEPRRDYLHVDDLVRLLIMIMEQRATGTFNAGVGVSISVADLAIAIRRLTGVDKPIVSRGASRHNEIPNVVADISRVRHELQWTPSVPLEAGLSDVIAYERCRMQASQ